MFLHIFVVNLLTEGVLTVDLDELVACHDAYTLRRTARCGADDRDGVADQLESHANALKAADKRLVGFLHVFL